MNCTHSPRFHLMGAKNGCCACELESSAAEIERLRAELNTVANLIDDVLYDPHFKPVTQYGEPIKGDDFYLTDHPAMDDHMPVLRQWFVRYCQEQRAAEAKGKP